MIDAEIIEACRVEESLEMWCQVENSFNKVGRYGSSNVGRWECSKAGKWEFRYVGGGSAR